MNGRNLRKKRIFVTKKTLFQTLLIFESNDNSYVIASRNEKELKEEETIILNNL